VESTDVASQENDYYPCFRDSDGNWVDATLPNRKNCNQYYHCDRGISWPSECPPGMFYTPKIQWLGPLIDTCYFKVCVQREDALCAIDGTWGEWGEWSGCSVDCGNGVRTRRRLCDNPPAANGGDECPGTDIDLMLCNLGECRANITAMFVARITDLTTGQTEQDPLEFEDIEVNTDNSYSIEDGDFTAGFTGHYFMAFNLGALATNPINVYLRGDTPAPLGGRRSSTNHIGRDSINSHMIIPMNEGDKVRLVAGADTSVSADAGKPTSWAAFNVEDIGPVFSMFSYGINIPVISPQNNLIFDVAITDVNSGYDPATGVFSPRFNGVYLLTYGTGVDNSLANRAVDVSLACSGTCGTGFVTTKITRTHLNYFGLDTLSRAAIVNLQVGASITVSSSNDTWSSSALQTSFSGLYYNPTDASNKVAWYVARDSSWSDSLALDPVPFNRVVVNEGFGWGAEVSNYFTVPVTGYYLVTMSAGAEAQRRVDMRLYQDDAYIADVYRQSLIHDGEDTISRTGIFFFKQGERLRMRAIGNTSLYSSATGYETSFGGLLLFAGEEESAFARQQAEEVFESLKVNGSA